MTSITVIDRSGRATVVQGDNGLTLMEVIRDAGFDEMLALCGGCCSCATCHVHIDFAAIDALPRQGADENDLLDGSSGRLENSRLACQIPFNEALAGACVTIAEVD